MHPVLIKIGPLTIHTYGFLIAVGFLVALRVIRVLARRDQLPEEFALDLALQTMVVGLIGARVFQVLTHMEEYQNDFWGIFRVWEGGMTFFGGPMAATPFVWWKLRSRGADFSWRIADVFAPALAIAHSIGRLGCLAAGCCYGYPTELPWAIRLNSELVEVSLRNVPLHPTQIYESISVMLLFLALLWLRGRRAFSGQLTLIYFMSYAVLRSILEEFRGDDHERKFLIPGVISTSQAISLLVFGIALFFYYKNLTDKKLKGTQRS